MIDKGRLFFWERADWASKTFGTPKERGPIGPTKHLIKEANELLESGGTDKTEIADCLFLIFDIAYRNCMSYDDLFDECNRKLDVCRARTWPDFRTQAPDTPVEHDRSKD